MQNGTSERAKDERVKICVEAYRKKSETNKKIESTANITDDNGSKVERRSRKRNDPKIFTYVKKNF